MVNKTFGSIGVLKSSTLVVIFNLTIVVVILIEKLLSRAKAWAYTNSYTELFDKLVKELLQLGIISFILFLFTVSGYTDAHHDYLEAFDFTHVVILFIAFSFMIQAVFLVQVIENLNNCINYFINAALFSAFSMVSLPVKVT